MRGLFNFKLIMPLLLLGVVFFGWFLHRKRDNDHGSDNLKSVSGVKASISNYQANLYADDLHKAMDGFGTDESTIKKVLDVVNPEDWRLVHNAFGKRKYAIAGHAWFGSKRDLKDWLKKELGSKDKTLIKRIKFLYSANEVIF